jgi:hypothetical protein
MTSPGATEDWVLRPGRGDGRVSHVLLFDEGVAVDRMDLVAEAVTFLASFPGVEEVEHVEREAVEITAATVPTARLTEALLSWWEAAKQEQRPWQMAVDRAAGIVSDLLAARGYQRRGGELTRVLDAELSHVITLNHQFGYGLSDHKLTLAAAVKLTLPETQWFTVALHSGELDDGAALAETIAGRVLPTLDALPSVDALLERWHDEWSIAEAGHRPHPLPEARLHARVLISRGRLADATPVFQRDFERSQPRQRPYLLELAAGLGITSLTTGTNPHLSLAQEDALTAWHANAASMTDRLRALTGLPLDASRQSVDDLWAWLRDSRDLLQASYADAAPALALSYYGVHTGSDIARGQVPFEPWYRVTVELVTAYLGQVVMGQAPGTQWGIGGDGELALLNRGGTGLLWRVITIVHEAFGAPDDEFNPRRLRQLVDDMVRWVNDGRYPPWIVVQTTGAARMPPDRP